MKRMAFRRSVRRLLIVAVPVAAIPVALALPAGADATPAACVSISTTNVVSTNTGSGCQSQAGDAGHVIGAQVCSSPGSSDPTGVSGDPISGMTVDADAGVAWVDAAGSAASQQGGATAGSGSTAVGAGDDVGTQCAPGG